MHTGNDALLFRMLLVAGGGALGAMARFGVYLWLPPRSGEFPLATLLINLAGCFLAGLLTTWLIRDGASGTPGLQHLAVLGFLGAFTTFSAFGMETFLLMQSGALTIAVANALSQLILGVLAVAGGAQVARLLI